LGPIASRPVHKVDTMSTLERDQLKSDAKRYIEQLYTSHRNDDIESWSHLIEVIFLYIDAAIEESDEAKKQS